MEQSKGMVKQVKSLKWFSVCLALVLFLGIGTAVRADSFTFDLGNPGVAGNNTVSSPYANVEVTGNTSTGIVDFKVSVAGTNPATLGAFGFNYSNVGNFSLASFTGTGGNTSSWGLTSGGQMDGFGSFAAQVGPSSSAAGNRLTGFEFQLQLADHSQALASNFEVLNSGGGNGPAFSFAQEYFPNSGGTGYVGVSNAAPTPAPPSVVLLGIGLVGLACYRRRQQKRLAVSPGV